MKKDLFVGLLIGLSLLLMTGSAFSSAAEGDADGSDASADAGDASPEEVLCAETVIAKGDGLLVEYKDFLDTYFKQNTPSSEQVTQAMKFYRYFEEVMHQTYADAMGVSSKRTFEGYASETSVCVKERDDYIDQAGLLLQSYVRYSANMKRTVMMVDGLHELNNNMEDFSMDFHSTFPALFNEMSNALPCYAQKCISK